MLGMDRRLLVLLAAVIIFTPACRSKPQAEGADAAKPAKAPVLDKALIEQLNAYRPSAGPLLEDAIRAHNALLGIGWSPLDYLDLGAQAQYTRASQITGGFEVFSASVGLTFYY